MKKMIALLCSMVMVFGLLAGCGGSTSGTDTPAPTGSAPAETTSGTESEGTNYNIALITMDSIDQHWVTLNEGAQKAAQELGVTVTYMAPNTKDDAQQIEQVNNAVAAGCQAIIVAANGPDAITSALQEAVDAGVKIIYVDSPANMDAEATFSTDNEAAGKIAGETLLAELEAQGVTSGSIGIINTNAASDSTLKREAASAPSLRVPTSPSWRPSTARATPPRARPLLRTTSPRASWVSSAPTKAPPPAPATPSRPPVRALPSASASISPMPSWA